MRSACVLAVLLSLAGCAQAQSSTPATAAGVTSPSVAEEAARLRAAFAAEVPKAVILDHDRTKDMLVRARAMIADHAVLLERPQLVVVVDRNPAAQDVVLMLAQPTSTPWEVIGAAKVSTGQRGRFDYYITPTGVFRHSDAILGYRAEGTYNENGIRGLGVKGMRVWDFGWHNAEKGWRSDRERGDIRLLMHATDPVLEPRIGRPASQGCVRVPGRLNVFFDRYGVLDADYERAAETDARYRGLLRANRTPSSLAGNLMLVVDSAEPL